jgi:hypothetical protein
MACGAREVGISDRGFDRMDYVPAGHVIEVVVGFSNIGTVRMLGAKLDREKRAGV